VNPSYLRLRRPIADALRRYGAWIGVPELEPPREVAAREAIDLALIGEEWKGLTVYVFSSGPWTVFEELSDEQDPSADVDVGSLAGEPGEPCLSWIDAARWVDEDQENLGTSERGLLWIHARSA
jgi:hypothetical protein